MKFMLMLISFFMTQNIFAQELLELITDRPDITESSETVPKKSIQIETGFIYSKDEYNRELFYIDTSYNSLQTNEYLITPSILARCGITKNIELRFGAQLTTIKYKNTGLSSTDLTKTDIEGVELGAKFKLSRQRKILPSAALIVGTIVHPTRPGDLFDPSLVFCFSNDVTNRIAIGYNLGLNLEDGINSDASGSYSFCTSYAFGNTVGIFAEAYGNIPFSSAVITNYIDGGLTVLLKKNIQLDFSGGYGLNSGSTEYFLSSGISFRLPK